MVFQIERRKQRSLSTLNVLNLVENKEIITFSNGYNHEFTNAFYYL